MIPLAARTEVDWVALSRADPAVRRRHGARLHGQPLPKGDTLESLDEWGLGGRKFGTWVTWFLLGGDLYTAYTFIAVPAAMFAMGSVAGFFAVPYTIILYPIIFIFMARLWSVSHRHGYVTTADFVRGRYDSRVLSLAVAVTGFVATMPYIALQLVGIQAVLDVVGLGGGGNWFAKDLPLLIAFVLLAAYTYTSGLRAPAVIAFVKDALIYLVIIVAIIYLPTHDRRRLGRHLRCRQGEDGRHQRGDRQAQRRVHPRRRPDVGLRHARARLGDGAVHVPALGHRDPLLRQPYDDPAQRLDPAGVLLRAGSAGPARLGRDRGRHPADRRRRQAQPAAGHPAAVRGLVRELVRRASRSRRWRSAPWCRRRSCRSRRRTPSRATSTRSGSSPTRRHAEEAKVSKIASLVVKAFALVFVLTLDKQNAINFQLLGGIWILQTFPVIVFSLYTRWFHKWALLAGWAVGHGLRHHRGLQGRQPGHRQALRRLARARSRAWATWGTSP